MNDDMKQVLEELEKDLFDEDLLEDMPESLKQGSVSDETLVAFLTEDDMLQEPAEPEQEQLEGTSLEGLTQSATNESIPEEDLDVLLANFLAENDEATQSLAQAAEPAFEDPDKLFDPEDMDFYDHDSNNDGKDSEEMAKKAKEDKWQIALMGVACGLCVAIIGVMIYWLETFLK